MQRGFYLSDDEDEDEEKEKEENEESEDSDQEARKKKKDKEAKRIEEEKKEALQMTLEKFNVKDVDDTDWYPHFLRVAAQDKYPTKNKSMR